jgi:hypothetical protein
MGQKQQVTARQLLASGQEIQVFREEQMVFHLVSRTAHNLNKPSHLGV